MKTTLLYFGQLAVCLIIFFGCAKGESKITALCTIEPLEFEPIDSKQTLANYIDSIIVIKLETSDKVLLHYVKKMLMTPSGEFLIMDYKGVYHFSSSGEFIRSYGREGRGPDEYITLGDIGLDFDTNTLYVLDEMNKVLMFNAENGSFIKYVEPDISNGPSQVDGIIPLGGDSFYLLAANIIFEKSYSLFKYDDSGKLISKYLPVEESTIPFALLSQGYDNGYLIRPLNYRNIIYRVGNDDIEPAYRIDFGDKNIPQAGMFEADRSLDMETYGMSKYYKMIHYVEDTNDYVSFLSVGPNAESYSFVYSKNHDKGISLAAPNKKTFPFKFNVSSNDYFYGIMDKLSLDGLDEHADPLTKLIVQKSGVLEEEENPRIVGVKFKF